MRKHSRNESERSSKYDHCSTGYSRHRTDRNSPQSSLHEKRIKRSRSAEQTNLVNFSFIDHKTELNRVLTGHRSHDQLVNDVNDFWLFLNKYETLLKNSGQSILPEPKNEPPDSNISKYFDKALTTNCQVMVPFDELFARLAHYEHREHITPLKLRQFLQIVSHYLDFKHKEKFLKLKKLRHAQRMLPVAEYQQQIVEAVQQNQIVLIAGDTGCGKSTQVPQYLYKAGYKSIACTQPRRIACISLAKRVSHEMLCEYGTEVGYQIRFERSKSTKTRILFITEGLLLRQLSTESSLSQYEVLVLDEVHERHLHGDFLLGVTKCLLQSRTDLKLILMSATINIKLFSDYFSKEQCHVIEVPGRLYPIKLHYMPQIQDVPVQSRSSKSDRLNPEPYIQIMQLIDNKYPSTEKGDLLIFMSGLNEITTIVDAAREYADKKNNWIILPLHSTLSIADQDKVFDYAPDGIRKCVVSTNIAETSVTIDGIRFVVDSGKVKEMSYDPQSKMQRLKEFWISKASADQRKGRAGRTGPGVCYRLYSEKTFQELESYSAAEIHRVPLESLLLQMIAMGLPNARLFPFIEPPPAESIENSIFSLKQHDALTIDEKLTPLGQALSRLPVDIAIGKMLLMGCVFRQLQPILTMAAALSIQSPFTNRAYRDHECELARKELESDHGDPITILHAYKAWLELKQAKFNRHHVESTKQFCWRRGLEEQRFYEMTKLRRQFEDLLIDCNLIEAINTEKMSSGERAIRHGELRQLKQMRRAHKMEAPRRRKLLKSDPWGLEIGDADEVEGNDKMDIRDVEFRLSYDSSKINALVSGASACSYKDLITLKLILVSGLYPQIAISDEFNYCKAPSQQFYHTQSKPFACIHPLSYFANNPQMLQLNEPDIVEKTGPYRSKLPLSSKHQLLCYLSLLETTKPYLMNTLRMPAAQTLLLFAHSIETNASFSRVICDLWLCLDFPISETGLLLLIKAWNLRKKWKQLLEERLAGLTLTVDGELTKNNRTESMEKLEMDLWQDLAQFMNTEIPYTLKRLLPADLKDIYKGNNSSDSIENEILTSNPFDETFRCTRNVEKGGMFVTDNICYNCRHLSSINETEWSIQIENDIASTNWICANCENVFQTTAIQKFQHKSECQPTVIPTAHTKEDENNHEPHGSNTQKFYCNNCKKILYLSAVDKLKHKRRCDRNK